jgi:SAM-dependent methyltransferase
MILGAAGLRPGGNVLDVGCGCGGTTLAAARLVAPGQATGLDLSAPMLARARADAGASGLDNVLFVQGDAQVHPLGSARFDAVLSRFGVMFFDDPVAAFANIRSATRPAGQLVFVCWQPLDANPWLLVPGAALAEHVPVGGFGAGDGPGMFAFADPDRIRQILAMAGWRDIEITGEHASILVGGGGGGRRRGGVPAHRVDRPDHPRRSRRPHGGPRDRVGARRARPVRGRRGRAPGRCGLARPGHRPVAPASPGTWPGVTR